MTVTLDIAAQFEPYQEVELHAKVAGYVKEIYVDIGDRVVTGQLLALLEVPELQEDLARALASMNRYKSEIIQAQSQVSRYEAIAHQAAITFRRLSSVNKDNPNLIAQQEIDVARANSEAAAAQVSSQKASVSVAEQQLAEAQANERRVRQLLDFSKISAPFTGTVTKRYVDTGTLVQTGTASNTQSLPVVRVSQINKLRLIFPVPESAMSRIKEGALVSVIVPSLNTNFEARVWRYAAKANPTTRTMETQILVENPDLQIKPGMVADIRLALDHSDNSLSVPIEAIFGSKTERSVWVVNTDKKIEQRAVVLGLETPTKYEVLSGLKEGDLVVVAGRDKLKLGDTVTPKTLDLTQKDPK